MRLGRISRTNSTNRVAPTPSPHSTDDLLPTLEEDNSVRVTVDVYCIILN